MVIRKNKPLHSRMNIQLTKLATNLTKHPKLRSLKENTLSFTSKLDSFAHKATPMAKAGIQKTWQVTHKLADSALSISHRIKNTEKTEPQKKNTLNLEGSYVKELNSEQPMYLHSLYPEIGFPTGNSSSQTQELVGIAEQCLTCTDLITCVYRQNMPNNSKDTNLPPCYFAKERQ
jgi:hypothetical protein